MRKRKLSRSQRKALRTAMFNAPDISRSAWGSEERERAQEARLVRRLNPYPSPLAHAPEKMDTIRRAPDGLRSGTKPSAKRPGKVVRDDNVIVPRPRPEGHMWFK